jgi:hypothetical protein
VKTIFIAPKLLAFNDLAKEQLDLETPETVTFVKQNLLKHRQYVRGLW